MSRKDMIIVASLINAGLLIVLFATALKSDGADKEEMVVNPKPVTEEVSALVAKTETPVVVGDEVDRALQQFATQQVMQPLVAEVAPLPAPAPSVAAAAPVNPFVDDLKSIAAPEPLAPQAPAMQTLVAPMVSEQKVTPEVVEVKVKKGDVLEKLARHHHSTVAEIMKANNLTGTNLRIGQVLKIPQHAIGASSSPKATTVSNAPVKMYTVKKGDSPWTIAVKNRMKVEDLLKLNNMNEAQAKRLKPGDQLRIQ